MQTRTSVGRDFQDNILGRLIERHQVATIFLRNRMSLRGRVIEFDPYVLLLEPLDGSPPQMVYKSAIVSISAPRPMRQGGRRDDRRPPREGDYPGGSPPPRFREPRPRSSYADGEAGPRAAQPQSAPPPPPGSAPERPATGD